MSTCFVMQPFDGDVYDKRYETVFAPAIRDADLEPYRVDRDPGASVPIDSIETGIRNSQACFAEITTDNPNVWFELGFAIALRKEVVLVCSEERKTHFPFDVQHRSIIKYRTGAPQDFDELRQKVTKRLKALIVKQSEIARVSSSPLKNTEGLEQHEIVALVTIMENQFLNGGEAVAPSTISTDMYRAGFTALAASIATRSLEGKSMIGYHDYLSQDSQVKGYLITPDGEAWILANQDRLQLQRYPDLPF